MKKKIKILVSFSGGKDSLATLIWAVNESGFKKENIQAVFCDTGWEHKITYTHINEVIKKLGVNLIILKSKKYNGFVDMAIKKGSFPSGTRRFCTEELKIKPMIDYIIDECQNVIVLQGIRKDESKSRSLMQKQCTFFKYYEEPYGIDKNGNPKYHTYRKKDVLAFRKKYLDDVLRPVFDWTGIEVMQYILKFGFKPNPLYYQGFKRVGCFPCIMCNLSEIKQIINRYPDVIEVINKAEQMAKSTFFSPDKIPQRELKKTDPKTGKKIVFIADVVKYIKRKNITMDMFEEDHQSCQSYYHICE